MRLCGWGHRISIGAALIAYAMSAGAESRIIEVRLTERVLPESQRVLRFQEGEDVTLRWSSNHAMRIRLPEYRLDVNVTPGRTETTTFRAHTTGRFKITTPDGLAPGETTIGYLEVQPR